MIVYIPAVVPPIFGCDVVAPIAVPGGPALQETHGREAQQHGSAKECSRLLAREILDVADDLRHVAIAHRVGNILELRGRLAYVVTGLRDIAVELVGGPPNDTCDIADIVGARRFLLAHASAQLVAGVGGDFLGLLLQIAGLRFHRICCGLGQGARLSLHVAPEFLRLIDHAFGFRAEVDVLRTCLVGAVRVHGDLVVSR